MATLTNSELELTKSVYPPYGFGLPNGINWSYCRVTFHKNYYRDDCKSFFYQLRTGQSRGDIIKVITEAEDRLELHESKRFVANPVKSYHDVMHCEPGSWWNDPVRFTLLTLFLRESQGNLKYTLMSGNYASVTVSAINRFLDGFVYYRAEKFDGWRETFSNDKPENLTYLGKKPTIDSVLCCHHPGWQYVKLNLDTSEGSCQTTSCKGETT